MRQIVLLLLGFLAFQGLHAQIPDSLQEVNATDTLTNQANIFTLETAANYINGLLEMDKLWRTEEDTLKAALERLLYHYTEPFDSIQSRLSDYQYDSISFSNQAFINYDSIPLYWLNDTTFIFDTIFFMQAPFVTRQLIVEPVEPMGVLLSSDTLPEPKVLMDSIFQEPDTIYEVYIDSLLLDSLNLQMYNYVDSMFVPPLMELDSTQSLTLLPDSTYLVLADTSWALVGNERSPFYIVPNEQVPDSLQKAVYRLLEFTNIRDSIPLDIKDIDGNETRYWISTGKEELTRYWIKNSKNDSITVWVGNPDENTLSVLLEDQVNINRMSKRLIDDVPITLAMPETSLLKVELMQKIPQFWQYNVASNLAFSQTYLSNWSKGGESALSTLFDIKGEAKYINSTNKTSWNNNGRIKYGSIFIGKNGLRTNTDIFELNSKFNKSIKGKFDFSATFYMKNQVAKGYKYPTDSTRNLVSKFLSPGTFTIGLGTEYKPFKHTMINLSPISYKNTFVLDTVNVDQTSHGIEIDKKVKQEMGGQLVVENSLKIWKGLEINNSMRFFANYFAKPMNVDVDWEINLKKQITWFFTVSANLHMIYDKDILFPVIENDIPVVNPDGSPLKVPKMQFKEFVGLSFSFNF
ncbi:DUF3078 domain-containing protein [Bacteroidota bacterium]